MQTTVFLQTYQQLQFPVVFDWLINLNYAVLSLSDTTDSSYFNYAQVNSCLTLEQLHTIENVFSEQHKYPAIYIESRIEMDIFTQLLKDQGYDKYWEDVWMFHDGTLISDIDTSSVRKVVNETDLKIYLETFENCYQKDDPQNPYGELGDYLVSTKNCWLNHNQSNRIEYFIAYNEDKPVAVSALNNFAGIGYISNVGSIREVRGKGYGKKVSLHCLKESVKHGNVSHCLATEEGHYPYHFYQRIGFIPKFSAVGYTKINKENI